VQSVWTSFGVQVPTWLVGQPASKINQGSNTGTQSDCLGKDLIESVDSSGVRLGKVAKALVKAWVDMSLCQNLDSGTRACEQVNGRKKLR
jgi:hypothetical protein